MSIPPAVRSGARAADLPLRGTVALAVFAGLNLLAVLGFHWYTLVTLGPGRDTDALFASLVVPQLAVVIVSGSLIRVLVPLLAGGAESAEEAVHRDAWSFLLGVVGVYAAGALVLYALAPLWVPLTVPGFETDATSLAIRLARIHLCGLVFSAASNVLLAVNHAQKRFIRPELASVGSALLALPLLVWGVPRFGVSAAAWAFVSRPVLQAAFLSPAMGPFRAPDWGSASIRKAWRRLVPLLAGTSYYKTGPLFDRFLASVAPGGHLSMLYLAEQLYSAGHFLMGKTIAAPMVPALAAAAGRDEWPWFRRLCAGRLRLIMMITPAALVLLVVLGRPVLSLIFDHGRFGAGDLVLLYWLLLALAGTWVGGAAGEVLASSFYALGDTATPTKVGTFGFTVGLALKALGFWRWGVVGLAVGTSAYMLMNAGLMAILLRRKLSRLESGSEAPLRKPDSGSAPLPSVFEQSGV